jgi:hypothetical protein
MIKRMLMFLLFISLSSVVDAKRASLFSSPYWKDKIKKSIQRGKGVRTIQK